MFRLKPSIDGSTTIQACNQIGITGKIKDDWTRLTIHCDILNKNSSTLMAYATDTSLLITFYSSNKESFKKTYTCNFVLTGNMKTGELEFILQKNMSVAKSVDNQPDKLIALVDHIKLIVSNLESFDFDTTKELATSFLDNLIKIVGLAEDPAVPNDNKKLIQIMQCFKDEADLYEQSKTTRLGRRPV